MSEESLKNNYKIHKKQDEALPDTSFNNVKRQKYNIPAFLPIFVPSTKNNPYDSYVSTSSEIGPLLSLPSSIDLSSTNFPGSQSLFTSLLQNEQPKKMIPPIPILNTVKLSQKVVAMSILFQKPNFNFVLSHTLRLSHEANRQVEFMKFFSSYQQYIERYNFQLFVDAFIKQLHGIVVGYKINSKMAIDFVKKSLNEQKTSTANKTKNKIKKINKGGKQRVNITKEN